jgi:branched-subunit amino acid ABC-type transport system permease component
MTTTVQAVAQGLSLAAVLLLSSLGLTIIYGVMGVVNLAHGDLIMLGAYATVLLTGHVSPWLAIALAPVIVAGIGLAADRTLIRWMYRHPVKSMLGTYALGMIARQLILITEGPALRYTPVPLSGTMPIGFGAGFALWRAALIVVAAAAAVIVWIWLTRSRSGLRIRLASADPEIAQTLGTNVNAVSALAFAIGAALAGLAGALVAPLNSVSPTMGTQYLVDAFLVVVLAGLGSVKAAVAWSAVVGIATAIIAIHVGDITAQLVIWAAALIIVGLRRRSLTAVRV